MRRKNKFCVIDYSSRLRLVRMLLAMSFACCVLTGFRVYWTGNISYLFLIWNLFLAWVPLLIAYKLQKFYSKFPHRNAALFFSSFAWLLFFPNSPYIITDLIHVGSWSASPIWFDGLLVFTFALTGLISGFISLYFIHEIMDCLFGRMTSWIIVSCIFLLTGYGIYLGRVLRWNSWDLFTNPFNLIADAINGLDNPQAIFMTLVFSVVMAFVYLILHSIIHLKYETTNNSESKINQ